MSKPRIYGCLRGELWTRPDFAALSPTAKLTYLFMFSHRDGNQAGVFRLPSLFVAHDLRLSIEQVDKAFVELEAAGWLAQSGEWLALLRMMEHDPPPNRNAAIGAARATLKGLDMAPGLDVRPLLPVLSDLAGRCSDEVLADAVAAIKERLGDGLDTVSTPYESADNGLDTMSHHNQYQNQDHHQAPVTRDHAQSAQAREKRDALPSPDNINEIQTPVQQEQDDLTLEVERITDPKIREHDSPQMRAMWRASACKSGSYTRFLISNALDQQKENTV